VLHDPGSPSYGTRGSATGSQYAARKSVGGTWRREPVTPNQSSITMVECGVECGVIPHVMVVSNVRSDAFDTKRDKVEGGIGATKRPVNVKANGRDKWGANGRGPVIRGECGVGRDTGTNLERRCEGVFTCHRTPKPSQPSPDHPKPVECRNPRRVAPGGTDEEDRRVFETRNLQTKPSG